MANVMNVEREEKRIWSIILLRKTNMNFPVIRGAKKTKYSVQKYDD